MRALEECFLALAERPLLGRRIDLIREGFLRYEHASHSIFYKPKDGGILIVRVLHKGMDSERQLG